MNRLLIGVIAVAAAAQPALSAEKKCTLKQVAKMPVTMVGTRPLIAGAINGVPMKFLVDSGAFFSMLSNENVATLGIKTGPLPAGMRVTGVGGVAKVSVAKAAEFSLAGFAGGHTYKNVDFLVGMGGLLPDVDGIIGQNVIGTVDIEYDLANGFVRLFQPKDCKGAAVAYWRGDSVLAEMELDRITPSTPHLIGDAKVNGRKIRVMFDTGASLSVLDSAVAAKVGITPDDEDVRAGGTARGIGRNTTETYLARFDTLDLGGELIKNARLRIGDISTGNSRDMLLGADFFLSHRVYVSKGQSKLYFTYNGGPVFDLRPTRASPPAATLATTAAVSEPGTAVEGLIKSEVPPSPEAIAEAASLRRRGAASAGRNDFAGAITDFDQAIKLNPTDADNYLERGTAYARSARPRLALSDYDQALKLKPDHIRALIARGGMRLMMRNEAGARADFDEAVRLDPSDTDAGLRIAMTYASANRREEAVQRLGAWIDANPKDARLSTALYERCWSRAILGTELDLAIADCDRALKIGSRDSQALERRAFAYLRNGDYDKSIADYNAALKLQPRSTMSLYGRGLAKIGDGKKAEGDKDIETAIAIQPNIVEFYKRVGLAK